MKIIDLLNKIANGEEVPFEIKLFGVTFYFNNEKQCYFSKYDKCNILDMHSHCLRNKGKLLLNEEVEILEEEKKIPEKLPYYSMEKIQKAKNKDEWREERITLLEKRVEDLHIKMNDLLDYLKSKGDE